MTETYSTPITDPKTLCPFELFDTWFEEAKASEVNDPNAMCIATSDAQNRPSARMVLLKSHGEDGFKFHTNSDGRKGLDLSHNPYAALCFYWKSLRKQIRIEGSVVQVSSSDADTYFKDRPRARQIGAWASQQSREMENYEELKTKIAEADTRFEGQIVPRPPYWNGYRVIPDSIEFWMDNPDRLHSRFIYKRDTTKKKWQCSWLYP